MYASKNDKQQKKIDNLKIENFKLEKNGNISLGTFRAKIYRKDWFILHKNNQTLRWVECECCEHVSSQEAIDWCCTPAGPTDLSMKKQQGSGGSGTSRPQLNPTEVNAVRQLIAGYRESAAFLLRSADELESILLQQNWRCWELVCKVQVSLMPPHPPPFF